MFYHRSCLAGVKVKPLNQAAARPDFLSSAAAIPLHQSRVAAMARGLREIPGANASDHAVF
jgi:hypothetical protein